MKLKTLVVIGTRPEAIKMAPLVKHFQNSSKIEIKVCVTAQHRHMLDQALELFGIIPDFDLNLMRPNQTLTQLSCNILEGLDRVFCEYRPDWVIVHGDTTTAFASSIAAYYQKLRVAHVEAGLRTHNISSPWPEEGNRQIVGRIAALHFAPTEQAKINLIQEGVNPDTIHVTGNTVIDALIEVSRRIDVEPELKRSLDEQFLFLDKEKRLILVTGHRRENFGFGFEEICQALLEIAENPGVQIIYPVHLNPQVKIPVERILGDRENIFLIDPLEYIPFIYLMKRSYIILTDSGGVQEEAPSLGKPVLVMRERTERPEAINAGTVLLVGVDRQKIVRSVIGLLCDSKSYNSMANAHNPYGDGKASERIKNIFHHIIGPDEE